MKQGKASCIAMESLTSFPALNKFLFLLLLLRLCLAQPIAGINHYNRSDFPADFIFGSATSAQQYEGAAFLDGRTASIWDTFAHAGGAGGATGDVSCDGYHKYKEDIKLMVGTGLDAFRLSISWSRLIPNGRGPVNPKGLQYYNDFINELIRNGIEPHVTLSHLDLPQVLQDEYGGWLSRKIVKDFVEFADVCFREFGNRVSYWTTLNEVNIAAIGGYDQGIMPPGRCSVRSLCPSGDSTREPYTVVHNMLLSHSAAAKLYKEKYKATQNGKVGLNIYTQWLEPYTNSTEDVMAVERAKILYYGWVLNPLYYGDYPEAMKNSAQSRIPSFTENESEQIKGSSDFIGLNNYLTEKVLDSRNTKKDIEDLFADMGVDVTTSGFAAEQYPVKPKGLTETLKYLKQAYGNPPIYIHENGQRTRRNQTLNDTARVEYLQAYIGGLLEAIRNGSNAKGYFVWTFLDCMEFFGGYQTSYGMYYVDLDDKELRRYPKLSAHWYSDFLRGKSITPITELGKNEYVPL